MVSQKNSGRARRKLDLYETPLWAVMDGLVPFMPVQGLVIGDPCCGRGKMVMALQRAGARTVHASDVRRWGGQVTPLRLFRQYDFIHGVITQYPSTDALVINPPYGPRGTLAEAFIRRGLDILQSNYRPTWMAVLLPIDFDSAATRSALFDDCIYFHSTIVLRKRIEWFKRVKGNGGPSTNHGWFIWKSTPRAPGQEPVKFYGPATEQQVLRKRARALVANNDYALAALGEVRRAVARLA